MTIAVKVTMMRTDRHLLPRSNSNIVRIGNGTSSAGLTRAVTPQVAPHATQPLDLSDCNLSVSKSAALKTSADNEVSQGINGNIVIGGENTHNHPANNPAFSL